MTCYKIHTLNPPFCFLGNIGRYLNHSCNPNVFVQNCFVDTHDLRFPWVGFFSQSHITAGKSLSKDLWRNGRSTQIAKYIVGGLKNPYSFTDTQYFLDFLFMKLFFYTYKSWVHDPIWYFSYLCRKFSELKASLFLSSSQTSQNLKLIPKCPCLSSLKNKFQWTQKKCLTPH